MKTEEDFAQLLGKILFAKDKEEENLLIDELAKDFIPFNSTKPLEAAIQGLDDTTLQEGIVCYGFKLDSWLETLDVATDMHKFICEQFPKSLCRVFISETYKTVFFFVLGPQICGPYIQAKSHTYAAKAANVPYSVIVHAKVTGNVIYHNFKKN